MVGAGLPLSRLGSSPIVQITGRRHVLLGVQPTPDRVKTYATPYLEVLSPSLAAGGPGPRVWSCKEVGCSRRLRIQNPLESALSKMRVSPAENGQVIYIA